MSLPPVFPTAFYKLLAQGAQRLGMGRAKLAMTALRYYLKAVESKNAPLTKALGSEELAERYADAQRKIARKWWSKVSEEERKARAQKAIKARWSKKDPPAE
jgi:hypothetical protein